MELNPMMLGRELPRALPRTAAQIGRVARSATYRYLVGRDPENLGLRLKREQQQRQRVEEQEVWNKIERISPDPGALI